MASGTGRSRGEKPGRPAPQAVDESEIVIVDTTDAADAALAAVLIGLVERVNEIAERMAAPQTPQAPTQAPAQVMPEAQARTMLSYRLLRNGLGNYGGHGDGFDQAWVDMTYYPNSEVLTFSGLPDPSASVRAYFTSATGDVKRGDIVNISGTHGFVDGICPPPPDKYGRPFTTIGIVEVLDSSHLPIAAGMPSVDTNNRT